MGKTDVRESDYLEDAEIFADLVNGILYKGEQVVKPQDLREQDGELRSAAGNDVKKVIRDKVRLWKGTVFAVFSVENQTRVDYRMVTRAMLAEGMAYDRQWKALKKKLEKVLKKKPECGKREAAVTADEFISGMRREDKFIPVITIVVYYGKGKPWDGARELHELLDVEGNEERVLPFISNYRLNLFDYHEHEEFGQFHSELQTVFEFLRYSEEKEQMKKKLAEHQERYEGLSSQAKILLLRLANIKKIPGVGERELERGEFSMCKAFEDMKEEGREEGKIEGKMEGKLEGRAEEIVETGYEFGLTEEEILIRLQQKLRISLKEAEGFLEMFGRRTGVPERQ